MAEIKEKKKCNKQLFCGVEKLLNVKDYPPF